MYTIKYNYVTGDSFGSETRNEVIEHTFAKLETAKENLKRIKEHYEWYCEYNNSYSKKTKDELKDFVLKQRWCAYLNKKSHTFDCNQFSLILIDDIGFEFQFCTSWCGYFESLNWAQIEQENPEDDGTRIEF